MSTDAIYPVAATSAQSVSQTLRTDHVPGDFSAWLSSEIENVNRQIIEVDSEVRKLAVGDATNLHQVMIALEKTKLSFEMVVQVRNKLLETYQDVMRMQI